jgi:hypothetical protein
VFQLSHEKNTVEEWNNFATKSKAAVVVPTAAFLVPGHSEEITRSASVADVSGQQLFALRDFEQHFQSGS